MTNWVVASVTKDLRGPTHTGHLTWSLDTWYCGLRRRVILISGTLPAHNIPQYSTEYDDALELAEKLSKEYGYRNALGIRTYADLRSYTAWISGIKHAYSGISLARAICNLFLFVAADVSTRLVDVSTKGQKRHLVC